MSHQLEHEIVRRRRSFECLVTFRVIFVSVQGQRLWPFGQHDAVICMKRVKTSNRKRLCEYINPPIVQILSNPHPTTKSDMGRPININSPARPSHASQVRRQQYVLPPVPEAVAQAIRATVRPSQYQTRIRNLTNKLQDQQVKQEKYKAKIKDLEAQKDEQLRVIRETNRDQTRQIISALEKKVRDQYAVEEAEARKQFEEKLQGDLGKMRAEFKEKQKSKYNHEPARKRIKLLEEMATSDETVTDGAIAAIYQPALEAIEIKSHDLQTAYQESENALEKLNESRADMIWLLKQVIKIEAKDKVTKKT
jgi:hypothetical protein